MDPSRPNLGNPTIERRILRPITAKKQPRCTCRLDECCLGNLWGLKSEYFDIPHVGHHTEPLLNRFGHDLIDTHNGNSVLRCSMPTQM